MKRDRRSREERGVDGRRERRRRKERKGGRKKDGGENDIQMH